LALNCYLVFTSYWSFFSKGHMWQRQLQPAGPSGRAVKGVSVVADFLGFRVRISLEYGGFVLCYILATES
jgi:hypothetical protein